MALLIMPGRNPWAGDPEDVPACDRCGQGHIDIDEQLIPGKAVYVNGLRMTHWFTCPETGAPVMVRRVAQSRTHMYRQRRAYELVEAIEVLTAANGFPPTIRELKAHLGWSSTSTVDHWRKRAETLGLLQPHEDGRARAMVLA